MKTIPGEFIDTKATVKTQRYNAVLFEEDGEVVTVPVITAGNLQKEWLAGLWPLGVFQDRFSKVK